MSRFLVGESDLIRRDCDRITRCARLVSEKAIEGIATHYQATSADVGESDLIRRDCDFLVAYSLGHGQVYGRRK
jgi:hypothetical protein